MSLMRVIHGVTVSQSTAMMEFGGAIPPRIRDIREDSNGVVLILYRAWRTSGCGGAPEGGTGRGVTVDAAWRLEGGRLAKDFS